MRKLLQKRRIRFSLTRSRFRGYDYFVLGDEIVIVDPSTRRVVEIIEDVG
jgi:hypothetical protein